MNSKTTNCEPKFVSIGIQCNRYLDQSNSLPSPTTTQGEEQHSTGNGSDCESEDDIEISMEKDPDYVPDSDEENMSDEMSENERPSSNERKYIVYETQLLELFKTCLACSSPALVEVKQTVGSMVKIQQNCGICSYNRVWESQPYVGAVPAGNLLISCAILFSGSIPSKALRVFEHKNIAAISSSTFQNHQKYYLQPSTSNVWKNYQDRYVAQMTQRGDPLTLGGDGRADTPGHSAKFGSYGMIDLDLMAVVDIQFVQSNEVKSSYHMEKEGFTRSVQYFESMNLEIGEIVTDRHVQLVKHIRENMPNTTHYFDVWHVAKGLKKKLTALSKEKHCEELQPWIKSMCNHMYWVAASMPDGNGELMMEKWESLGNHIQNVHTHEGKLFHSCQHGPLD